MRQQLPMVIFYHSRSTKTSPKKRKGKGSKESPESKEDDYEYIKPPMSPELLIAIAVINLDPDRDAGASCTDIVAFLSIHFPYFSTHYDECKVGFINILFRDL